MVVCFLLLLHIKGGNYLALPESFENVAWLQRPCVVGSEKLPASSVEGL